METNLSEQIKNFYTPFYMNPGIVDANILSSTNYYSIIDLLTIAAEKLAGVMDAEDELPKEEFSEIRKITSIIDTVLEKLEDASEWTVEVLSDIQRNVTEIKKQTQG